MCVFIMFVYAFDFRSSYCVASTLYKYLRLSGAVQSFRYNTFYFVSRSFKINVGRNVEVNSGKEKLLEIPDTNKKFRQPTRDVLEYMNSKDSLKSVVSYLPSKILRRKRTFQEPIYIVDRDVAKDIAIEVVENMRKRNVPVYEINPGIGILSKELLHAGVNFLNLCEPSNTFYRQLQAIMTDFPAQTELIQQDLLTLGKLVYLDRQYGGSRVQQLFEKVSKCDWTDDPSMIIVGTLPSLKFIKHLIHCHIYQISVLSYGRPELYVMMSPGNYFYLTSERHDGYLYYRSFSVLFQLIFQFHVLKKLPRKAFLPWNVKNSNKKWSKSEKIRSIDPDYLYLVKIVPRQDFFENVVKVEQLQQFWYFIWHHMMSRKNRVIPQLEKWIPGCGPRLINCDMTIHTEFGDLTPQQILSLFHEFTSWPEFPDCPFLSSMENALMVMEQSGDELTKHIVKSESEDVEDENVDVENLDDCKETER